MVGIALLVIELIFLAAGFNSSHSPAEEWSEAFTGRFSDQTMFYLVGGAVGAVIGLVMLVRK